MITTDRPDHRRQPGYSIPVTPADMTGRVAHLAQLAPDRGAFPDLTDGHRARTVCYLLSPDGLAGEPSPVRAPHGFHLAVMHMPQGVRPSTHAHPYNEVFMPSMRAFASTTATTRRTASRWTGTA